MSAMLQKLTRKELRRLKSGDWVAWGRTHWHNNPLQPGFAFWEGRVVANPLRTGHNVMVLLNGVPHAVHKNQLFKVLPTTDMEHMHEQFDYNC